MIESIIDSYPENEIWRIDGFDDAVIGYHEPSNRVIYSVKKIIELICLQEFCDDDTFTMEQAFDYYAYNIESNGCGEFTPILCNDNFQ